MKPQSLKSAVLVINGAPIAVVEGLRLPKIAVDLVPSAEIVPISGEFEDSLKAEFEFAADIDPLTLEALFYRPPCLGKTTLPGLLPAVSPKWERGQAVQGSTNRHARRAARSRWS